TLSQNYPNPFNPSTTIRFALPKEAPVTLEIYNILGMKIRTLISGQSMNAAFHSVVWDGKDDAGVGVSSGLYLYRIHADKFQASKKMTLLK
ncbi:MAG: T9SS type A sorting domain-containing protein, partial [Ignavibacteriales bacterium]|nr:T9SS type A sorting domain-containing protein [Ignavibacteriales bacterium]